MIRHIARVPNQDSPMDIYHVTKSGRCNRTDELLLERDDDFIRLSLAEAIAIHDAVDKLRLEDSINEYAEDDPREDNEPDGAELIEKLLHNSYVQADPMLTDMLKKVSYRIWDDAVNDAMGDD